MEVESFYTNLFREDFPSRPLLDVMDFDYISELGKLYLENPFWEEEILNMIMGMKGNKSPGLDEFTISFFQNVRTSSRLICYCFLMNFTYLRSFYDHLNNTFITLIPKKRNARELKDF